MANVEIRWSKDHSKRLWEAHSQFKGILREAGIKPRDRWLNRPTDDGFSCDLFVRRWWPWGWKQVGEYSIGREYYPGNRLEIRIIVGENPMMNYSTGSPEIVRLTTHEFDQLKLATERIGEESRLPVVVEVTLELEGE